MARQAREHVQAGLLAAVAAEPAAPVRRDTAAAVAAAARLAVPAGQWPALLPWLGGMAGSDRPEHREAALDMLSRLVRTIGAGVCLVDVLCCVPAAARTRYTPAARWLALAGMAGGDGERAARPRPGSVLASAAARCACVGGGPPVCAPRR